MMPFVPMSSRERALATAFADLAGTLVADDDVSATLQRLCMHCVDLLEVDAAEVLLTEKDRWTVSATSDGPTGRSLGGTGDGGPYRACLRTGKPVRLPDMTAGEPTWPRFVADVRLQGYASAYTLPMRLGAATHGVLGLFGAQPDSLTPDGIQIGQALADAVMAGITQRWALHSADARAGQLQEALDSRVVIEQAKGILAQRGSIDVDQAFLLLRKYARSHSESLHGLAGKVISQDTLADDILHGHRP